MKNKVILILGGYGGVGRHLSRLILKETTTDLIIAGRRQAKAEAFATVLNREYSGDRVSARYVEASGRDETTSGNIRVKRSWPLCGRFQLVRRPFRLSTNNALPKD